VERFSSLHFRWRTNVEGSSKACRRDTLINTRYNADGAKRNRIGAPGLPRHTRNLYRVRNVLKKGGAG
jgi:hypothetical protein